MRLYSGFRRCVQSGRVNPAGVVLSKGAMIDGFYETRSERVMDLERGPNDLACEGHQDR